MAKVVKKRYFLFIVYPESAPDDWMDILKRTRCPYAVSPLHQPDDEHDKPHYHVIFYTPGPITLENAYDVIPSEVPANGHIEWAKSSSGSQRYLIHLDDPDKEQFEKGAKAIKILNGFPLDLTREYSAAELRELRRRVLDFIREYEIMEYCDLVYGLEDIDLDMQDYACNHTILFDRVISSRRNKLYEQYHD